MRQKRRRQEIRLYKLIIGSVLLGLVFLILFFVTQGIYRGGIINNILGILIVIILNVIMLLCSITSFCGTIVFFVLLLITKIRTKRDEELIKSKLSNRFSIIKIKRMVDIPEIVNIILSKRKVFYEAKINEYDEIVLRIEDAHGVIYEEIVEDTGWFIQNFEI